MAKKQQKKGQGQRVVRKRAAEKKVSGKLGKEPVITLRGVTKEYTLRHAKPTLTDLILKVPSQGKKFKALDNFDLTIYKGEKVGIIGRNGAGKTTLLKIIAGITTPNAGSVEVKGKVVSLIDLSAGFHPDLSGSENIFLNGIVIGMKRNQIEDRFKEIVEFADIGEFIEQPMYTYSDGMQLRLGFAIAVHADPDIFLMDEGFSVGDEGFRKKCEVKIDELAEEGKTVVMVSHWVEYLRKNADFLIKL
jgi:ABC-2 type transport system ATP-binding protein